MVAGIAFGFVGGGVGAKLLFRGGGATRPLIDRTLVRPQGFGQQVRMIESFQQPALRSGFVGDGTVMRLGEKNIQALKSVNRSSNYSHITWIESGQTRTASIGEMSHAGTFHDRGGLSKAGRALDKKAGRIGSVFPKPKGTPHEINTQGQRVLDEILNHPNKTILKEPHLNFGEVLDVLHPDGHGARFTIDGKKMIGFLEPKR
jgi:hypothetical protein